MADRGGSRILERVLDCGVDLDKYPTPMQDIPYIHSSSTCALLANTVPSAPPGPTAIEKSTPLWPLDLKEGANSVCHLMQSCDFGLEPQSARRLEPGAVIDLGIRVSL